MWREEEKKKKNKEVIFNLFSVSTSISCFEDYGEHWFLDSHVKEIVLSYCQWLIVLNGSHMNEDVCVYVDSSWDILLQHPRLCRKKKSLEEFAWISENFFFLKGKEEKDEEM